LIATDSLIQCLIFKYHILKNHRVIAAVDDKTISASSSSNRTVTQIGKAQQGLVRLSDATPEECAHAEQLKYLRRTVPKEEEHLMDGLLYYRVSSLVMMCNFFSIIGRLHFCAAIALLFMVHSLANR
jgi:hypothetical protein